LLGYRGGEKVLDALAQLFPNAELFTLFADRSTLSPALSRLKLHTSWLNTLPGAHRYYRRLLPLMPQAIERFDLRDFDLVMSSSHCVAKGVRVPEGVPHVCYCHSPMRYAWHLRDLYLERVPIIMRPLARRTLTRLREWDRRTAIRVSHFIANGKTVQRRIREAYGRESVVIHPPVDTDFYRPDPHVAREDWYLVISALVPNKRIDLAIRSCQQMSRRLLIIGTGPEEKSLRSLATCETQFLGWCTNDAIRDHLRRCRALLFPGEEDFGLVPIEANACGTGVIAYGQGGATETIVPPHASGSPTGLWFTESSTASLVEAMQRFEATPGLIRPDACRQHAERFRQENFFTSMKDFIEISVTQ
jgi:glycosyltransferase involved in cell wall biosynthesis